MRIRPDRHTTALLAVLLAIRTGCSPSEMTENRPIFVDRALDSGLDFVHDNGMTGELYFAEMFGSGVALFDYDTDGDLDLYLVQGGPLETGGGLALGPSDRLYRNDLRSTDKGAISSFVDVTARAGIEAHGYGMGVATGDFDRSGGLDLYVTNLGANQLWRSDGEGGFIEVGVEAGVAGSRWSTSAAFADLDHDGWPDLYVTNYTDFRLATHDRCTDAGGAPDYCGPRSYRPEPDRLLRNRGDGTFEDISSRAGLLAAPAAGLGVVVVNLDGNRRPDVYVANDQMANQLWINLGDGALREEALTRGLALDRDGQPQASMGIGVGDVDGDDDDDIFLTHIDEETNTLYVNEGQGLFRDGTSAMGLAGFSLGSTGFGTALVDYDGDGRLDLLTANGAVRIIRQQSAAGAALPLGQHNQFARNTGARFIEASDGEPALLRPRTSRGLATGDIDNDGDVDVVVTNNNGPVELLINEGIARDWIGFRLKTTFGSPATGSRVRLKAEMPPESRSRTARADGSYLSSSDPRVVLALANAGGPGEIAIEWPGGKHSIYRGLPANRWLTATVPESKDRDTE